jgi:hypothetical protein
MQQFPFAIASDRRKRGNPLLFRGPFSREKEWVINGQKLEKESVVKTTRSSFSDKTSRRILFYRDTEALQKEIPEMTVFYMGVPDTSPEVLTEKEMDAYFEKALERVRK